MTTSDTFRQLALSFPRANERAILGSQEFRVRDKAFATLGWPEPDWAVVRLTPADQSTFLKQSKALSPEPGGRGRRGVTRMRLNDLNEALVESVIRAAWRIASDAAPP